MTAEAHGLKDPDLGPDEYELNLDEGEIKSGNQRELNRVKQELAEKKKELDGLKKKVSILHLSIYASILLAYYFWDIGKQYSLR